MHGMKKGRKKEKSTPSMVWFILEVVLFFSALADIVLAAVDQVVQIGQQDADVMIHFHIPLLSLGVD